MEVFDAVRTLLAVRQYADTPVPGDVAERIAAAGHLSASSSSCRIAPPCTALARWSEPDGYIAQAQLAVVVGVEKGSQFGISDGSRAIQDMMLVAWSDGVGSNWTGFRGLEEVGKLVDLPSEYEVLAVLPFGYPATRIGRGRKQRKPIGEVVSRGRFGEAWA